MGGGEGFREPSCSLLRLLVVTRAQSGARKGFIGRWG